MLDVIDEQFLMLHLVLKTEPDDPGDLFRVAAMGKLIDERQHLFIDMRAIFSGFRHRWPRTSTALWPLNPRSETLVVRIEEEEKVFAVRPITRLKFLQHRFEEPRSVADMPARRRHKLGRLDYVVFNFERRDDLRGSRADGLIEIGNRFRAKIPCDLG